MKRRAIVKTASNKYVIIDTCLLNNTTSPLYETMVFPCSEEGKITSYQELDQAGYDTSEEAEVGHKTMVQKWRNK